MKFTAEFIKFFSILVFATAFIATLYVVIKETGLIEIFASRKLNLHPQKEKNLKRKRIPNFEVSSSLSENMRVFLMIALLVASTRIFLYVLGYMGVMLVQNQSNGFVSSFQSIWNKWDADHYIFIAKNWYVTTGDKKFLIVFYPFYPIIIKAFTVFIPNYFLSGILVSNFSLMIACYYLYKLVEIDFTKDLSLNAVKYLLVFPVSFFLSAPFSESLFLALSVMTLYHARKNSWLLSGVCGLLAAFTRSLGLLLFVPVFIEFFLTYNVVTNMFTKNYQKVLKNFLTKGISLFFIPFGTLFYVYINKRVTGDALKFLEYQKDHWNQSFGLFYENMKNFVLNAGSWKPADSASLWLPQLIIILCAMFLLLYGFGRIRASYMAYFFLYLFVAISPTWLLSGPRYIMGIFPLYILLALLSKNKIADMLLTSFSTLALCYCVIAFVTGHLIM